MMAQRGECLDDLRYSVVRCLMQTYQESKNVEDEYADFESASETLAHAHVIKARLNHVVHSFRMQFLLLYSVAMVMCMVLTFFLILHELRFTAILGISAELRLSLGIICLFVLVKIFALVFQIRAILNELRDLKRLHDRAIYDAVESLE